MAGRKFPKRIYVNSLSLPRPGTLDVEAFTKEERASREGLMDLGDEIQVGVYELVKSKEVQIGVDEEIARQPLANPGRGPVFPT